MGCLCAKNHAVGTIEEEIKSLKLKNAAYEATLAHSSTGVPTAINLSGGYSDMVDEEQIRTQKTLKSLLHYIGIEDISPEEIVKKVQEFRDSTNKSSQYLWVRLEESELEKKICEQLIHVVSILKQIDSKKAQHIKSKTQSVENLIQEQYPYLMPMINIVKEKEMVHSSSRGGTIEQILMRLHSRSELDKELELVQTKLENEQYAQLLNAKDEQLKQIQQKIKQLRNEKNDIERSWELVKMNIKTDPEELRAVQLDLEDKEKEFIEIKKKLEEIEAQKHEIAASKQSILEIQNKIKDQEDLIKQENEYIKQLNKHNEDLSEKIKEIPNLEKQIAKLIESNKEKESEAIRLEELHGDNAKAIREAVEKMNEEIQLKEARMAEISVQTEKVNEDIKSLQAKRIADIKKQVAIRVSYALKKVPERSMQRWKWMVFNRKNRSKRSQGFAEELEN
ncbi:unnamed protein product [Blepharisma stoltei]|uniref:Uncharacterized protein n=1 Tax=Blepharisma stoltei TaxID=1481888 RepID=A0AAU9JHV3_9CILI|nr:unnamed protein product [Blepharisma stoltei]